MSHLFYLKPMRVTLSIVANEFLLVLHPN